MADACFAGFVSPVCVRVRVLPVAPSHWLAVPIHLLTHLVSSLRYHMCDGHCSYVQQDGEELKKDQMRTQKKYQIEAQDAATAGKLPLSDG